MNNLGGQGHVSMFGVEVWAKNSSSAINVTEGTTRDRKNTSVQLDFPNLWISNWKTLFYKACV